MNCRYFSLSLLPRFRFDSGFGDTASRTLPASFPRSHLSEGSSMRRSDVFSEFSEEDMEEELEKTKVVKAFWDLRQEVRMSLNNICFSTIVETKIFVIS